MAKYSKAILFGCSIGLLGILTGMMPFFDDLDQGVGLYALFQARGQRSPPTETMIISIDRESAQQLDIIRDPVKWPRSVHATLLDVLTKGGAKFVAFVILFDEHRVQQDDRKFAAAIKKSGNVILCGCTLSEHILLKDADRKTEGTVMIESFVPPVDLFTKSALATASFPLPRMPARLDQCWSFKLGNTPTLPVVAFQLFGMDVYDVFASAIKTMNVNRSGNLPIDRESLLGQGRVQLAVRELRDQFQEFPGLDQAVLESMNNFPDVAGDPKKVSLVYSLIKMYTGDESRFIN